MKHIHSFEGMATVDWPFLGLWILTQVLTLNFSWTTLQVSACHVDIDSQTETDKLIHILNGMSWWKLMKNWIISQESNFSNQVTLFSFVVFRAPYLLSAGKQTPISRMQCMHVSHLSYLWHLKLFLCSIHEYILFESHWKKL